MKWYWWVLIAFILANVIQVPGTALGGEGYGVPSIGYTGKLTLWEYLGIKLGLTTEARVRRFS
jgi:hypothetical protein